MRWGVVSTISEPAPLVYAFVAHYAALGASRIDIHLDAPAPDVADRLRAVPGCRVFQKSARDWVRAGHFGPPSPPRRQAFNAQESYASAQVDWLFHVDADEFLVEADDVLAALRDAPPELLFLGLAPVERVLILGEPDAAIFDGAFRRMVPSGQQAAVDAVYGPAARFLDAGLSSNGQAKSFCRTGRGLVMGVHEPLFADGGRPVGRVFPRPVLLHFDGMTEAHFLAKLDRKISQAVGWRSFPADGRRAQLHAVATARGDAAERSGIFRQAKCVTPDQAQALAAMGLLNRTDFDCAPAMHRTFPGLCVDFSCAHFDSYPIHEMALPWYWRLWNEARGRTYALRRRFGRGNGPGAH